MADNQRWNVCAFD